MRTVFILLSAVVLCGLATGAGADNDTPHNATSSLVCDSCHGEGLTSSPFSGPPPTAASMNDFCVANCHNATAPPFGGSAAPAVAPHGAATTSDKYGDWLTGCTDCHHPHKQEQMGWRLTAGQDLFLLTGRVTGYSFDPGSDTSTLTCAGLTFKPDWDPERLTNKSGAERRAILFPNLRKLGYNYPVLAVDEAAATITVGGDVSPVYAYIDPPTDLGVIYGQLLRRTVTVDGVARPVRFYGPEGANAFATAGGQADGICQVCHTRTNHWRNDGSRTANHFSGQRCTECHPHDQGFKPRCDVCHGEPPATNADLVHRPQATGSVTSGAHALHAGKDGYHYPCTFCHAQGMPETPVVDDNRLQIGFAPFGQDGSGTSYDGQLLAPPYSYQGTNNTTVTQEGSLVCTNVYCHSQGKRLLTEIQDFDLASSSPPWDESFATWDPQNDGNRCNNCHGYPPTFDAHVYHFGRGFSDCGLCHAGTAVAGAREINDKSLHANGVYDVIPGPSFVYRKMRFPLYFEYTFAPDGGTCAKNTCHQKFTFQDPKQWVNRPQAIQRASLQVEQGQCSGGSPQAPLAASTVAVSVSVVCRDCTPPYTCDFDWGDGTRETGVPCTTTHTYADALPSLPGEDGYRPDPTGNVIGGFEITWAVRDSFNVTLAGGPVTQRLEVCPLPNQPPVARFTIETGPDPKTYDVELTDLSVDPDYDLGTHWSADGIAPGTIFIDWGDGSHLETAITLTDQPSNQVFTHVYPRRGIWWIRHGVKDNTGGEYVWSPVLQFKVGRL